MRTLFILLLLAPFVATAQINRSANELARETTKEFVVKKLFKGQAYQSVSYGELKPYKTDDIDIEWMIEHRFETKRPASSFDKNANSVKTAHRFIFFLDHQMKVKKAESYSKTEE